MIMRTCKLRGSEDVNLQGNRVAFKLETNYAALGRVAGVNTRLLAKLPQRRIMDRFPRFNFPAKPLGTSVLSCVESGFLEDLKYLITIIKLLRVGWSNE